MAEKPKSTPRRPAPPRRALPGSAQGPRAPAPGPRQTRPDGAEEIPLTWVGNSLGRCPGSHAALMERLIADWLPARLLRLQLEFSSLATGLDPAKRPRRSADVGGGATNLRGEAGGGGGAGGGGRGAPRARSPPPPAHARSRPALTPRRHRPGSEREEGGVARTRGLKLPNGCSGRPSGRLAGTKRSGGAGWKGGSAKRGPRSAPRTPRAWPERCGRRGPRGRAGGEARSPSGPPRDAHAGTRAPQPRSPAGEAAAPSAGPGAAVRAPSRSGSAPPRPPDVPASPGAGGFEEWGVCSSPLGTASSMSCSRNWDPARGTWRALGLLMQEGPQVDLWKALRKMQAFLSRIGFICV